MAISVPGLPYFSLNVKLDDPVKLLQAEFGLKGFALYIHLLRHIYGVKGYYTEWHKDVELMFADSNHASVGFVSEIVQTCLRRGIFNDDMYVRYGVLTSKEIQENYFNAAKRRKEVKIISEILLIDPYAYCKDVNILRENVNILRKNVNNGRQRREEERREDKNSSCCSKDNGENNFCDEGKNVQNFAENSGKEDEDNNISAFSMISAQSGTTLIENCDRLIYKYWCRGACKNDYESAAAALHILFLKNKKPFKELTADHMELLETAIQIAADADAKRWGYVKGIFRNWGNAHVFDIVSLASYDMKRRR